MDDNTGIFFLRPVSVRPDADDVIATRRYSFQVAFFHASELSDKLVKAGGGLDPMPLFHQEKQQILEKAEKEAGPGAVFWLGYLTDTETLKNFRDYGRCISEMPKRHTARLLQHVGQLDTTAQSADQAVSTLYNLVHPTKHLPEEPH